MSLNQLIPQHTCCSINKYELKIILETFIGSQEFFTDYLNRVILNSRTIRPGLPDNTKPPNPYKYRKKISEIKDFAIEAKQVQDKKQRDRILNKLRLDYIPQKKLRNKAHRL